VHSSLKQKASTLHDHWGKHIISVRIRRSLFTATRRSSHWSEFRSFPQLSSDIQYNSMFIKRPVFLYFVQQSRFICILHKARSSVGVSFVQW
jgi:hypothetical protein